jgi:cell division protein FtsQ
MAARKTKRQQQKHKQQQMQRRWLASAIVAVGFSALLSGAVFAYDYLSQPGRLPLRVIEVNGEISRVKQEEIQRTVVAAIDGGFFSCDMQRLRAAVLAMPWVADVSIRRSWPDKLRMVVSEQVPLARWGDDALINVNGGVFRPSTLEDFSSLVKLSGPEGSQQRVVAFFQAAVPAARYRELHIREVQLDQRRHWWLQFDGGLTVSLGRENVNRRLAQFFRVYPSLVAQTARRPERVDMRYAHGFAVRWQESVHEEAVAEQVKSQGKV